jgi:histidinol-phosphate aminotransferase
MSYERSNIRDMKGYTWGEQPRQSRVIKLNTNENPYPAAPEVTQALQAVNVADLRRYPPPFADDFREVAARLHGVSRDNIMATNGGDELLRLIITTFANAGDTIAMAEPSYSLYPVLAAVQGCTMHRIPLNEDWGLPEDFAAQLNAANARIAFVVNPHAPTGQLLPVDRLAQIAEAFKGVLVIDEAYVDFIAPDVSYNAVPLALQRDNVILLRTMSKGYSLAGLRFAYGIAHESLLAPMLFKTRDSYNTDLISQRLATAALGAQAYAQDTWRRVREERSRLATSLEELGFGVLPSHSNFLLVTWAEKSDLGAQAIYQALKDRGILVRFFDQPRLRDKLRITVGTIEENDALLQALKQITQS